jgi:bacteriocin-like protein
MKTITETDLARVTGGTHTGDPPPLRIETAAERRKRFIDRIQSQPMPSESEPGLGF